MTDIKSHGAADGAGRPRRRAAVAAAGQEVHMRVVATVAASVIMLVASVMTAFPHAQLVHASPAADSSVSPAPGEIALRFSERLEPAFSSITVRNSAGEQVDRRDARLNGSDRMTLRVSLPPLQPDLYKVEWRAVSADAHKIEGGFSFRVID